MFAKLSSNDEQREALMREIDALKAELSELSGTLSTMAEENAKMASAFSAREK